jgi:uncharacterized protein YdhG (YjbR/CyaY superfamily)
MSDIAKSTKRTDTEEESFTEEERLAIKERAKELKATARRKAAGDKADPEAELLAKIAEMPEPDRTLAERIHTLVTTAAPELTPKTWYGMPAYAKNGQVVFFFQNASKFKARYATIGFNEAAALDDGDMWATSFALVDLTPATEAQITALLRKAVG